MTDRNKAIGIGILTVCVKHRVDGGEDNRGRDWKFVRSYC